jgi:16S rRNA (adenine1518-N6/adenine1519-N6)-dimethyltransferase
MHNRLEILRKLSSTEYNHSPSKALGQHFLTDSNITDDIVRFAGSVRDCPVIEVGPGLGILTRSLLFAGANNIFLLEKDRRLIKALEQLKQTFPDCITLINEDALRVDEASLGNNIKVVANLPYNIATPLIDKWLDNIHIFNDFTIMVQKELADRLSASPGSKDYGRLSVIVQLQCDVSKAFDLPPEVFTPPPKVMSSVIKIKPKINTCSANTLSMVKKITKILFEGRRKMLRKTLKLVTEQTSLVLEEAEIDPVKRPEELTLTEFCKLAEIVDSLQKQR